MTDSDEHPDFTRLAGALALLRHGVDQGALRVEEMHTAISGLSFDALARIPLVNTPSGWVRRAHDGVLHGAYAGVRASGAALLGLAAIGLRRAVRARRAFAASGRRADSRARFIGDEAVAVINGIWGDHLAEQSNPLAIALAFRHAGHDLPLNRRALAAAYPDATPRLAIFVHGLVCSERSWARDGADPEHGLFASLLARRLGCTPLFVRYNSGLAIRANARALAQAIGALERAWPVPVQRIDLIGHSMGGLILRACVRHAVQRRMRWLERTRDVVYLGSPHRGAPLEALGGLIMDALDRFDVTRPLARAGLARSVGIRDLRLGDAFPDQPLTSPAAAIAPAAARLAAAAPQRGRSGRGAADTPAISLSLRNRYLGGTLARRVGGSLVRGLGDGLVPLDSAVPQGIPAADGRRIEGVGHMQLLVDTRVAAQLLAWLRQR